MCKCEQDYRVQLNDTVGYSGIEIVLLGSTLRVRYYEGDAPKFVSQDMVQFDFCPLCGRSIRDK